MKNIKIWLFIAIPIIIIICIGLFFFLKYSNSPPTEIAPTNDFVTPVNDLLKQADNYGQKKDCSEQAFIAYRTARNQDESKIGAYILYCKQQQFKFDEQKNKLEQLILSSSDAISSLYYELKIANLYSNLEMYTQALQIANSVLNKITPQMLLDKTAYSITDLSLNMEGVWIERTGNFTYAQIKGAADQLIEGIYKRSPDGSDGDYL